MLVSLNEIHHGVVIKTKKTKNVGKRHQNLFYLMKSLKLNIEEIDFNLIRKKTADDQVENQKNMKNPKVNIKVEAPQKKEEN